MSKNYSDMNLEELIEARDACVEFFNEWNDYIEDLGVLFMESRDESMKYRPNDRNYRQRRRDLREDLPLFTHEVYSEQDKENMIQKAIENGATLSQIEELRNRPVLDKHITTITDETVTNPSGSYIYVWNKSKALRNHSRGISFELAIEVFDNFIENKLDYYLDLGWNQSLVPVIPIEDIAQYERRWNYETKYLHRSKYCEPGHYHITCTYRRDITKDKPVIRIISIRPLNAIEISKHSNSKDIGGE